MERHFHSAFHRLEGLVILGTWVLSSLVRVVVAHLDSFPHVGESEFYLRLLADEIRENSPQELLGLTPTDAPVPSILPILYFLASLLKLQTATVFTMQVSYHKRIYLAYSDDQVVRHIPVATFARIHTYTSLAIKEAGKVLNTDVVH